MQTVEECCQGVYHRTDHRAKKLQIIHDLVKSFKKKMDNNMRQLDDIIIKRDNNNNQALLACEHRTAEAIVNFDY